MSKNEDRELRVPQTGTISRRFVGKVVLKIALVVGLLSGPLVIALLVVTYASDAAGTNPDPGLHFLSLAVAGTILGADAAVLAGAYAYLRVYVRSFEYVVGRDHLVLRYGVFTKNKVTIAYTRVQNVSTSRGVFDRWAGLVTVKVETAGRAASPSQGGMPRPEGYLPGLDADAGRLVVETLRRQILRHSAVPGNLGDLEFTPQDVAFDNFVAYVLTKMRVGEPLQSSVRAERERRGWSVEELAQRVGVKPATISQLEAGRFEPSLALALRLARVLEMSVEDLFSTTTD
ncbi:MAG: hypothetical protein Kow0069_18340 [Promethearchaeota archaeon]